MSLYLMVGLYLMGFSMVGGGEILVVELVVMGG